MHEKKFKSFSRGMSNDMSSQAISKRLDILSELYELALVLKKSKIVSKVKKIKDKKESK